MKRCWVVEEYTRPTCSEVARLLRTELEKECPDMSLIPVLENDTDLRFLPKDDKTNLRVIKNFMIESTRVRLSCGLFLTIAIVYQTICQKMLFITTKLPRR